MKFTPGLENEDSFLIVPNEFIQDHELTQDEIKLFRLPNSEYARVMRIKCGWDRVEEKKKTIFDSISNFMNYDTPNKILQIKLRWNSFWGRKLDNPYK